MSMSARFSMFTTPVKPQGTGGGDADVEAWFTAPTPTKQLFASSSGNELYDDRVLKLRENTLSIANHHLTSVIAGSTNLPPVSAGASSLPQLASNASASFSMFLKTDMSTSTIIPPVSFKDFDSFLYRAKSKSGKAFTPHKEFIPSKPIAQMHTFPQEEMLGECYSKVPEEFFEKDFGLYDNNHTIDEFIEQSFALLKEPKQPGVDPQDQITQLRVRSEQRLSGQLDLVETCLFNETMMRKDAIFQTIANLQDLQLIVREENERVADLRALMAELKSVTTAGSVEVLALQSKTDGANSVLTLLDQISKAKDASMALEMMLKSNDTTGAFLLIEDSLGELEGELGGLFSLRTMTRQFREFKETTGNAMSESFLRVATADLFPTGGGSGMGGVALTDQEMGIKLMPWMRGMLKRGNARPCLNLYKLEMQRTLKASNEIVIVSFFAKPTESGTFLPQNKELTAEADKRLKDLRAMPVSDFFVFIQHLFEAVDLVLARAKQVDYSLHQYIFTTLVETEQMTPRECADLTLYSKDCLAQIIKSSQELFARILQLRQEYHSTRLSPVQFRQVFQLFETRGCTQVLQTQLELLIIHSHDKMQKQLVQQLDERETWEAVAAVPIEIQNIVFRLEKSDPLAVLFDKDEAIVDQGNGEEESKYLCVGSRKLRVLQSALDMIRFLHEYLCLAAIAQSTAWMCVGRMFDCVVLFDERTRRLILGTEVKQRKKLAVIGAKNLALTLQSLVAVHLLLPGVSKVSLGAVKPEMANRVRDELVGRMDKAFTDHESSLVDTLKLLVTMELNRLAKLEGVQWDAGGTEGLDAAQEYMITFAGKIDRLYSVLVVNLDRESLVLVFTRVLKLIDERIVEIYDNMGNKPTTPAGTMRVKVDILHLVSSLRKLKFLQGQGLSPGNALEDWINEKH
ncbi:hypothetical protein BASA81_007337 [Batrachochytrium salamandrivorans]|nr:hypothetical protein BASA81_007337 [Batrachochytrium salamandrivorans]